MPDEDRTIVDAGRKVMRCNHCGDEVPMPLGDIRWVTGVMDAFIEAHEGDHSSGRTTMGREEERS